MKLLRDRTTALHARVEKSIPIAWFCRDLARYRQLLLRLVGFYSVAENRLLLFQWQTVGMDFESRRKAASLWTDLRNLEVPQERICTAVDEASRIAGVFPEPRALAGALGCLYVLEGATLGGKIISRMIGDSLGLSRDTGAGFYDVYGDDSGRKWQEFKSAADVWCGDDTARADEAVRFASATFEAYESWLIGLIKRSPEAVALAEGDRRP